MLEIFSPRSDQGMKYLVGDGWRDYFEVVIVQARKPKFFTDETRPLRIYDVATKTQLWDRVTKLEKGVIYQEVRHQKTKYSCTI